MRNQAICLTLAIALVCQPARGQWVQTLGPSTIRCLATSGTNLLAGTWGGVFLSTNNGASWTQLNTGLLDTNVTALAVSGTNLFAGSSTHYSGGVGGVFLSTNNGTSWTQASTGLTNTDAHALAVSGTNLFVGTGGGVFLSTNNGTSWTEVNAGLLDTNVTALAISGANLFAGTYGHGVWRRPLSEMITSVDPGVRMVPDEFALSQNYPNPFNPSTTIRYELPHASRVSLKVYNTLGQEVATLVNETKSAGVYTVQFDAANLASGVYFYRLQAGDFVEVMKLVLLR